LQFCIFALFHFCAIFGAFDIFCAIFGAFALFCHFYDLTVFSVRYILRAKHAIFNAFALSHFYTFAFLRLYTFELFLPLFR
jgi:hypothetical protein